LKISETSRAKVASQDLRASYFASVREQFELYTELLMMLHEKLPSRGFDVVAFEVSERARARSLLETLSESNIDIRQGVDEALLKSERELLQQISTKTEKRIQLLASNSSPGEAAAIEKDVEALTMQYQQVQGQIRATSPRYEALAQSLPLTATAIQRDVLDSQTVLLEYLLGDERSWLWVVTPNSLKAFPLPPRNEIESDVRRVYGSLTERNRAVPGETIKERTARFAAADVEFKKSADKLSRMILFPALNELRAKRLVIVADGALHYIPFAALPDPSASSSTAQKQPPLIVNHEVVSLASASPWRECAINYANAQRRRRLSRFLPIPFSTRLTLGLNRTLRIDVANLAARNRLSSRISLRGARCEALRMAVGSHSSVFRSRDGRGRPSSTWLRPARQL
jgi:hypothetical protein